MLAGVLAGMLRFMSKAVLAAVYDRLVGGSEPGASMPTWSDDIACNAAASKADGMAQLRHVVVLAAAKQTPFPGNAIGRAMDSGHEACSTLASPVCMKRS